MKIKICRTSGLPVDPADLDNFKSEWTRLFDISKRVCKNDMLRLQKKLAKIETILGKKYPTLTEVEFCDTPEKMIKLIEKYGHIKAVQSAVDGSLVYAIDDRQAEMY